MRKFISFISVAFLVVCTACTNDTPWGIEYALNSNGKTDASVCVTFPNGNFDIDGAADYQFNWSSSPADTNKVFNLGAARSLDESLTCNDMKVVQAAEFVNTWFEEFIKVSSFEGHYDIYVKGYIKETKTQITFSIDRHFTNIPE